MLQLFAHGIRFPCADEGAQGRWADGAVEVGQSFDVGRIDAGHLGTRGGLWWRASRLFGVWYPEPSRWRTARLGGQRRRFAPGLSQ